MTITTGFQTAGFPGAPTDVRSAIRSASADTGVDFSYLMAKAAVESGFRADARAPTSSATGLFQFIESTWLDMVERHGAEHGLEAEAAALEAGAVDSATRREILALRNDPKIAAAMAAEYTRENVDYLERTVGGRIGDTERYLAHFLGAGGAEQFLRAMRDNPEQSAAAVMPAAARSNPAIFYHDGSARSLGEVYERFAAKFDAAPTFDAGATFAVANAGPAASENRAPEMLARAGAIPMAAESAGPLMLSPSSYAARLFLATLVLPGETADGAGAITS